MMINNPKCLITLIMEVVHPFIANTGFTSYLLIIELKNDCTVMPTKPLSSDRSLILSFLIKYKRG
jgi:hypothetical protein